MESRDRTPQKRFSYQTPWPAYALAWAQERRCHLAVGSAIEGPGNKIQVIELNEEKKQFDLVDEMEMTFPPTKIMWMPEERLAATTTTLNLWKREDGRLKFMKQLVRPEKDKTKSLPPLTSFDWSPVNPHKIGVSSVDTTCTIWNLEKMKIETQLIAHDRAVHDIAFSMSETLFASAGADGSVRLFDQRRLENSTIIYETAPASPLLRLAWSKVNQYVIATLVMDTGGVLIIDIRRPSVAAATIAPDACVNSIAWAPHSKNHLLLGTSEGKGLIWDVSQATPVAKEAGAPPPQERSQAAGPSAVSVDCDHEIYQAQWPSFQPDWIALGMMQQVEIMKI